MSSRRDFIKTAGTLAVASAIPAMGGAQAATKGNQVSLKGRKVTVDSEWDVIVVGGGPAGCTAAISAAREGARTLLIEAMGQLGGMGTAGMVPAWCPSCAASPVTAELSISKLVMRYSPNLNDSNASNMSGMASGSLTTRPCGP